MDTVYGTKKYFQSLSGTSDIYRPGGCRVMSNDYNYQNTLGRRSTLGAYYHMNKQPSYTNDHSLSSQYGYNTWGIWRDGRNIAPSTFSTKTHPHYQKTKSFSIILTTAAFIVLLAVISIAALAFYFSTIKANMEDPVLGFEGSFRIAKGDLFSTGLKYNHTTTYKQKIEFYKRFVERALTDKGLQPLRTDVWGFGEGPLIKVYFRTFLDVRKLPQNVHSVEEYIKESLFSETTAVKSLYRSLRLDSESVEIKRILDDQIIKSASFFKDAQSVPTSQTQLEKRLMKKNGSGPTLLSKPSATTVRPRTTPRTHSSDDELDIDVENAPVIQGSFEGSFEITKTDADIARKKVSPTKAYTSLPPKAITPYSLRVKPKKPSIEKLTTIIPQPQTKSFPTSTNSFTTTKAPSTTTTTTAITTSTTTSTSPPPVLSTTTTKMTTTTQKPTTKKPVTPIAITTKHTTARPIPTRGTKATTTTTMAPSPTTTSTTTRPTIRKFSTINTPFTYRQTSKPTTPTLTLPKLDSNLFTSIPVLDTQPWRPIHREVPEFLPGPPPALPTRVIAQSSGASIIPLISSSATSPMSLRPSTSQFLGQDVAQHRIDEIELPFVADTRTLPPSAPIHTGFDSYVPPLFQGTAFQKPPTINHEIQIKNVPDIMFYHNFANPNYAPASDSIERLGAGAHVKPHPLPVPLIDEVVVPQFRPINPTLDTNDKLPFSIDAGDENFEHLGGGVIVKKHGNNTGSSNTSNTPQQFELIATSPISKTTSEPTTLKENLQPKMGTTLKPAHGAIHHEGSVNPNSEIADTIGEFFMDLLNLPKDEDSSNKSTTSKQALSTEEPIESRIEQEELSLASLEKEYRKTDGQSIDLDEQTFRDVQESVTQATKPNFMNLRDIILKRKQQATKHTIASNHANRLPTKASKGPSSKGETRSTIAPTVYTQASTATETTTTTNNNRIQPAHKKPPTTILDDSNLFPSHSKWEFVNSSSSNSNLGYSGNLRRVYNKTLQAWVSGDVDKSENITLNDIKSRINNATNIQDISLIFDTLASKLGIKPTASHKMPPFSQNTLKQTHRIDPVARLSPTTPTSTSASITPMAIRISSVGVPSPTMTKNALTNDAQEVPTTKSSMLPTVTTKRYVELPLQRRNFSMPPTSQFPIEETSSESFGAAIPVVGEAEVEVIDPNKYEEMLKSSQFAEATTTETSHKLVTLLPVRSNSGVRTYRPLIENQQRAYSDNGGGGGVNVGGTSIIGKSGIRTSITRKSNIGQNRMFPPAEAVVKGGIKLSARYTKSNT